MRDTVETDRRAATVHLCRGLPRGVLLLEEDAAGDLRVIRVTMKGRETLLTTADLARAHAAFAAARQG